MCSVGQQVLGANGQTADITGVCFRLALVRMHASVGAYSSYTRQLGSFGGNRLCARRDVSAMQTKAREVETIRGFTSKACSYPNHSTNVDIATRTQLSQANKCLMSGFSISMACLLTPGRAHPSTNCRYLPKSKSLPQLHLPVRLQLSRAWTWCFYQKTSYQKLFSGPQFQPVLEELPTPSWWFAELPSARGHLPAIPGSPISTLLYLTSTHKGLLLSAYCQCL